MDAKKQESGEARRRSNALMKRLALRGGTAFVVFKDIKISLVFFVSPDPSGLGDAKKKREHKCYRDMN
jgi:hypothetical protein